jgi:hypothetical protein
MNTSEIDLKLEVEPLEPIEAPLNALVYVLAGLSGACIGVAIGVALT